MVELPWYVENNQYFLAAGLILVLSFWVNIIFPEVIPGSNFILMAICLFGGLACLHFYYKFSRYKLFTDALGPRLARLELIDPLSSSIVHATLVNGKDVYVHYFPGGAGRYRTEFPYFTVWIEVHLKPPEPVLAKSPLDVNVVPTDVEGLWKLIAKLPDDWLESGSDNIEQDIDALYEIRESG
ncbi:MAG: hypothetical protein QF415_13440 [Candidatus Undinarchaeales archaeon]|nr:hypothetical protein [Candidatus Undinarchaeales archaeon]MDP7494481.1 hypothetical protein [Candidatus Undinarchaeales archaeon]